MCAIINHLLFGAPQHTPNEDETVRFYFGCRGIVSVKRRATGEYWIGGLRGAGRCINATRKNYNYYCFKHTLFSVLFNSYVRCSHIPGY